MSLAERLASPPVDTRHQFCTVGMLLDRLHDGPFADADERRALVAALENGNSWTAVALSRTLSDEGYGVNYKHIRQHRNGDHTVRECAWPNDGVGGGS